MNRVAAVFLAVALGLPGHPVQVQAVSQRPVAAGAVLSGVVRDPTGGVIGGASVTVRAASGAERQTTSDATGRFLVAPPAAGDFTLIVRAAGFAERRMTLVASASAATVEVLLQPAGVRDEVTVTPTRSEQQLGTIPASVSVIGQEEIQRRPALVHDVVRQWGQGSRRERHDYAAEPAAAPEPRAHAHLGRPDRR